TSETWMAGTQASEATPFFERLYATRTAKLLRRERRLGLADDRLERPRLVDREIGEHLAVDGDAGLVEARDETAVIEAEGTHRGVEALNPQRAKRTLLPLAVAEGLLVGLF